MNIDESVKIEQHEIIEAETAVSPSPPQDDQTPPEPAAFEIPWAVRPQPVPEGAELKHPSLYFNQELAWIDFNWRVLHLALDERTPLLERVKFAAITVNNLDEFVQKRIGGLKRQEAAGVRKLSPDGRSPREQLDELREAILVMHNTVTDLWENTLKPLLKTEANIHIYDYEELTPGQQAALSKYFFDHIYPILTPLTVDPGHPFPFISNLSLSLAFVIRHPLRATTHFARLKIPKPRWIPVPPDPHSEQDDSFLRYLPIEQLIAQHAQDLFEGMEIVAVQPFRITRNAGIDRDDEVADDLLKMISAELRERRFAAVVRLEIDKRMPDNELQFIMRELGLTGKDVYEVDGLMDLTACFTIAGAKRPLLKDKPWQPAIPYPLFLEGRTKDTTDIFAIMRQGDILVHHPYDSFTASVQCLIEEAAVDPLVLAIKLTLYRTSSDSPIVAALKRAAEQGKQVAVLVEVTARFDEANNIGWARELERVGVHVAYGLVGLKTHTKATLIVRQEKHGPRTYCHIGTGNYHPKTAKLYTDFGLLTCDPELGRDIVNLFHFLTGYAPGQQYEKVLIAPSNMRSRFVAHIQQEIAHHQEHGNGRIIAKMNAIDDVRMIRELYRASQAGVQIDLIIRGHSRLRPGLPGYSDHIRIISILGRFLEHDRIFYFHNNGAPLTFIGSADWRGRNLNDRVELITPIEEPALQQRLIDTLELALSDNYLAWELDANGRYTLRRPAENESTINFHKALMKQAKKRAKKKRKKY
ncbi:MAG: polyphosphate kinase 1 [Chloroflexi bacterium]|nr:MAG: polyphosphate kinase 1 [Chloroflexota bacterium]